MKWFLGFLLCIFPLEAVSFPHLSLYRLDGSKQSVPQYQVEVFFIGFSPRVRTELGRWYEIFLREGAVIPYTVVPVFPAVMSFLRAPLFLLLTSYIPAQVREHVGVIFESEKELASILRVADSELGKIHIFVVDAKGSVLWRGSGGPVAQTIAAMKEAVRGVQARG